MSDFLKQYGWIFVAALSVILIIVGFLVKPGPIEIEQIGEWKENPTVIVCPSSPYSLEEVKGVVTNYKERGHTFDEVLEFTDCPGFNIPGWIMIKPAGQNIGMDEAGHATTRYDSATGEIISSTIEIFNPYNILVLEHELGHALGYQHVNRRGHIMYPNTEGLGSNDKGLYREEIISE